MPSIALSMSGYPVRMIVMQRGYLTHGPNNSVPFAFTSCRKAFVMKGALLNLSNANSPERGGAASTAKGLHRMDSFPARARLKPPAQLLQIQRPSALYLNVLCRTCCLGWIGILRRVPGGVRFGQYPFQFHLTRKALVIKTALGERSF